MGGDTFGVIESGGPEGNHSSILNCKNPGGRSTLRRSRRIRQALGRYATPCRQKCSTHYSFFRGLEAYAGSALAAPATLDRHKYVRFGFRERLLPFRRELDHRPLLVWIAERRENLSADSKIRMRHMSALDGFRKVESQAAKIFRGHADLKNVEQKYDSTSGYTAQ